MRMRYSFGLFAALVVLVFSSCKSEQAVIQDTRQQILWLSELNDSDTKSLATMLQISEVELKSVLSGDSLPSEDLANRSGTLYSYAVENGNSFKKLRAAYDPDFAWYDHILMSPAVHPGWFWTITIVLVWMAVFRSFVLGLIRHSTTFYSDGLYLSVAKLARFGLLAEAIVFGIAYLFSTVLK